MATVVAAANKAHAKRLHQEATATPAEKKRRVEDEETATGSATSSDASDAVSVPDAEPQVAPKPLKAYCNPTFLNSGEARMIRVMCELEEPGDRLDREGIENVVMFFGSARAKPRAEYEAAVKEAEANVAKDPEDMKAYSALLRLRKQSFLMPMFDAVRDLACMLTEWSMRRAGKPSYHVGTGGGPGMMTAANHGATLAGGKSVGFGISLPFEDGLNPYVTPELGFEYHYFFTRKFWMSYKCMGLVVAPGGLGTCDELFEILTLIQTGKIKRTLPVILIGKRFWQACINWDAFIDYGMISEQDARQLVFADTAEEAFPHLIAGIERLEATEVPHNGSDLAPKWHLAAGCGRFSPRTAPALTKAAPSAGGVTGTTVLTGLGSRGPGEVHGVSACVPAILGASPCLCTLGVDLTAI
eukprot:CAMPEP_0197890214 /NCGR_PEP_ID=MMETSP1439-20131203/25839_1 /TAXON_ID=66791 /ORGANISM="Gonyaulax spinifera, Strain CCMP409" /LENGTH=413 /DNA_ID=CAMNT_0043510229 /DNA_START=93 /DNA_END=1335 /DNA_ORIENTATION=+